MAKTIFLKFNLCDFDNKDVFVSASEIVRIYPSEQCCRIVTRDDVSMLVRGSAEEVVARVEGVLK